jgi:BASS family bile acid:Na+ symporter
MIGLVVAASMVAIIFVPATMWLLGVALGRASVVPSLIVARVIGATVLIPLALGFGARRIAPRAAARSAPPLAALASVVLIASMLPVLGLSWLDLRSMIGNGTLAATVIITGAGLFTGHRLGGPVRDDRTVLALATALRHPGIAIAIASIVFPDQKLVAAVILLALFVAGIASAPYVTWSRRMFYAGDDAVSRTRRPVHPALGRAPDIRLGPFPQRRK